MPLSESPRILSGMRKVSPPFLCMWTTFMGTHCVTQHSSVPKAHEVLIKPGLYGSCSSGITLVILFKTNERTKTYIYLNIPRLFNWRCFHPMKLIIKRMTTFPNCASSFLSCWFFCTRTSLLLHSYEYKFFCQFF